MKKRTDIIILGLLIVTILPIKFNSVTGNPIPTDNNYETSPFPDNYNNSVYFKQEIINVTFGEKVAFDAQYSFKNELSSETEISILLPFVCYEDYTEPDIINLLVNENELDYSWTNPTLDLDDYGESYSNFLAISFDLSFTANEEKNIHVQYTRDYQVSDSTDNDKIHYSFQYIVGTARAWNHPIEYAHFEFWIPKEICNGYNPPSYLEPMTVREESYYYIATLDYQDWRPSFDRIMIHWSKTKPLLQNPLLLNAVAFTTPFILIGILYFTFKKIKNRHYYSEN